MGGGGLCRYFVFAGSLWVVFLFMCVCVYKNCMWYLKSTRPILKDGCLSAGFQDDAVSPH